ncbi:MAG TPA: hypothetical protein VFW40_06655 [Capsulimonadaceae bacterium]|nr:hypothetical protein [Capsulimonadaceae bacterium]
MLVNPTITAQLSERFIFNFRMPMEALAKYLPVSWLRPQEINGYGVASYCLLDLRHITAAPLPGVSWLRSVSSAPRYGAVDLHNGRPMPAVYLTERQTSNAFGSWFTAQGCSAPHPHAPATISRQDCAYKLQVERKETGFVFTSEVRPAARLTSSLFDSTEDFGRFIAQGITSYGESRYPDCYTKIDLHKTEGIYEPLDILSLESPIVDQWKADGAALDSAFRTCGGKYAWTYYGLVRGCGA